MLFMTSGRSGTTLKTIVPVSGFKMYTLKALSIGCREQISVRQIQLQLTLSQKGNQWP